MNKKVYDVRVSSTDEVIKELSKNIADELMVVIVDSVVDLLEQIKEKKEAPEVDINKITKGVAKGFHEAVFKFGELHKADGLRLGVVRDVDLGDKEDIAEIIKATSGAEIREAYEIVDSPEDAVE